MRHPGCAVRFALLIAIDFPFADFFQRGRASPAPITEGCNHADPDGR